MSVINEIECDQCKKRVEAIYNGEWFMPPNKSGWYTVTEGDGFIVVGHLCIECVPKSIKGDKET